MNPLIRLNRLITLNNQVQISIINLTEIHIIITVQSYFLIHCSADDLVVQAGHLEKFRVFVIVRHDGVNMWVSPATFKSSCDLNVKFFPFDKQQCSMQFRSLTADRSLMDIYTKNIESNDPEEGNFRRHAVLG